MANSATVNPQLISSVFQQVIGRPPSAEEIDSWRSNTMYDPSRMSEQDSASFLRHALTQKKDLVSRQNVDGGATAGAAGDKYGQAANNTQLPQGYSAPPASQPSQTGTQPTSQPVSPTQMPQGYSTTPTATPMSAGTSIAANPNFEAIASRYSSAGGSAPGFEGYRNPSSTPTGAQVSAPAGAARSDGSTLDGLLADVQTYVKELSDQARGDYDFVIKYLDRQHKMALGTDDAARAKFFESVANELENNIGRIPYDYLQKTERERQDLGNIFRRNDLAKKQLDTSEQQFNEQQKMKAEEDQTKLAADMSSRGLIGSGIQQKESNKQIIARRLFEQDPFNADLGYKRDQLAQGLNESILGSNRNMEDITTGARRDSQDFILGQDKAREESQRDLTKTLAGINREGAESERNVRSLWDQQNLFSRLGS